jgi:hypothetical protein
MFLVVNEPKTGIFLKDYMHFKAIFRIWWSLQGFFASIYNQQQRKNPKSSLQTWY